MEISTKPCALCSNVINNTNCHYKFCNRCKSYINHLHGRERTRMAVRVRDNFRCQDCQKRRTPKQAKKTKKRMFDVHHVGKLCGKKSRAYDRMKSLPGMITLCHKCHYNRPEHKCQLLAWKGGVHNGKRDAEIIQLRKQGVSLRQIGKQYSITHQRVAQVCSSKSY